MNSPFRSAAVITASCIKPATSPPGGRSSTSSRSRLPRDYGSRRIPSWQFLSLCSHPLRPKPPATVKEQARALPLRAHSRSNVGTNLSFDSSVAFQNPIATYSQLSRVEDERGGCALKSLAPFPVPARADCQRPWLRQRQC